MPIRHSLMQTTTMQSPARRGAARPSTDGIYRIAIPISLQLSAGELIHALLATPTGVDVRALTPAQTRAAIRDALAHHGYALLARRADEPAEPDDDRYQHARRAVRAAYGPRFQDAPDEQRQLAEPIRYQLADWTDHP